MRSRQLDLENMPAGTCLNRGDLAMRGALPERVRLILEDAGHG